MYLKKRKFDRDLKDYESNRVYVWYTRNNNNNPNRVYKKKTILKNKSDGNKNVSFPVSEYETSDINTDYSDGEAVANECE